MPESVTSPAAGQARASLSVFEIRERARVSTGPARAVMAAGALGAVLLAQSGCGRGGAASDVAAPISASTAVSASAPVSAVAPTPTLEASASAPASAAPAGTFRPTPEQLRTLSIGAVEEHEFQPTLIADGSIALNGDRTTAVFSPYSGRVTRVIAKPGDVVERGAALAQIDASEFVQGQNDLQAAAAQVKLARISEARKKALYEAQGGSLQDWQQAQADLAAADVALKAARNRLRILGGTEARIDALESAQKIDAGAVLKAPIRGEVVDREVGPGQYVQAGSGTALYTLADLSSVWLVANVREEDAPSVRKGQLVEVTVGAFPGRVFKARIDYVAAALDPDTHRLPVRAEIPNPDGALKPLMFASFSIVSGEGVRSVAVPESAVVYDGPDPHVWVVSGSGDATVIGLRSIEAGLTQAGLVQVLRGLRAGERVVIRGSLFIDRAVTGD